jgi:hypothetical protein
MNLFNEIKADYEAELAKTLTEEEREVVLEQLHARSAPKVLALARHNGGIYNKAAQFVASLQGGAGDKGVPKAYVQALAVLTDGAPFKSFTVMETVCVCVCVCQYTHRNTHSHSHSHIRTLGTLCHDVNKYFVYISHVIAWRGRNGWIS